MRWEEQNRTGQDLIICLGFSITRRAARAIWMRGNKEGEKIFGYGKCELIANFSATWPLREERDGKCEGRNEKCEFLARESVSSLPIVRIFGKGKCKLIANFSAKMVTSLPSLSLYLCVCVSLSHRKYLTHNKESASALPIMQSNLLEPAVVKSVHTCRRSFPFSSFIFTFFFLFALLAIANVLCAFTQQLLPLPLRVSWKWIGDFFLVVFFQGFSLQ